MSAVWLVATNTLRQTVRQRLFLNIVVFGVGMVLVSIVVGQLTIGSTQRVVRSIGLSGVTIALDLMALLVAVGLIYTDIDKKTLFVVLTRPISRAAYVVGRYLGLMMALSVALLGLSFVFFLAIALVGGEPRVLDLVALGMSLPEAAVLGAFGLVLSGFSTPTLSAGLGLGFWIASATTDDLLNLTVRSDAFTRAVAQVTYYALPSLARFDFRDHAIYAEPVGAGELAAVLAYGLLYVTVLLCIACIITTRREMV